MSAIFIKRKAFYSSIKSKSKSPSIKRRIKNICTKKFWETEYMSARCVICTRWTNSSRRKGSFRRPFKLKGRWLSESLCHAVVLYLWLILARMEGSSIPRMHPRYLICSSTSGITSASYNCSGVRIYNWASSSAIFLDNLLHSSLSLSAPTWINDLVIIDWSMEWPLMAVII